MSISTESEHVRKNQLLIKNIKLIEAVIKDLTYKPNSKISLVVDRYPQIIIMQMATNAHTDDRKLEPIYYAETVPHYILEEETCALEIIYWIAHCVENFERHESQEWFKYKGEMYYDPHGTVNGNPKDYRERNLKWNELLSVLK